MKKILSKKLVLIDEKAEQNWDDIIPYYPEQEPKKTYALSKLPIGWKRATFILKEEQLDKLKALSYWERTTIKDLVTKILELYLQDKEIDVTPVKRGYVARQK